jgi:hypothetical protein
LDVLSYQMNISGHRVGHPLSFCFALVHVKGRGGWRSKSEWREVSAGDHDRQTESVGGERRGEIELAACE